MFKRLVLCLVFFAISNNPVISATLQNEITIKPISLNQFPTDNNDRIRLLFDFKESRKAYNANRASADYFCPYKGLSRPYKVNSGKVTGHGTAFTILTNPNPFEGDIRFMNKAMNIYLKTGNERALLHLKEWLIASAKARSYTQVVPDPDRYHLVDPLWNLRFTTKSMMISTEALIQLELLNDSELKLVMDWLHSLNSFAKRKGDGGKGAHGAIHQVGTHAHLHDYVNRMMWAVMTNNEKDIKTGIKQYKMTIDTLQPDGATVEVGKLNKKVNGKNDRGERIQIKSKGYRSLRKMNEVLGGLVVIAEIANSYGEDLYSYSLNGKDLFSALEFFESHLTSPEMINARVKTSKPQELDFLTNFDHGDTAMPWIFYLHKRFPDKPVIQKLINKLQIDSQTSANYGGTVGCFLGLKDIPQKELPEITPVDWSTCNEVLTADLDTKKIKLRISDCPYDRLTLKKLLAPSTSAYRIAADISVKNPRYLKAEILSDKKSQKSRTAFAESSRWGTGLIELNDQWCELRFKKQGATDIEINCPNGTNFKGTYRSKE